MASRIQALEERHIGSKKKATISLVLVVLEAGIVFQKYFFMIMGWSAALFLQP